MTNFCSDAFNYIRFNYIRFNYIRFNYIRFNYIRFNYIWHCRDLGFLMSGIWVRRSIVPDDLNKGFLP